jgi:hypothetical protein
MSTRNFARCSRRLQEVGTSNLFLEKKTIVHDLDETLIRTEFTAQKSSDFDEAIKFGEGPKGTVSNYDLS